MPAPSRAARPALRRALALAGLALLGLAPEGCAAVGMRVVHVNDPDLQLHELAFIGTRFDAEVVTEGWAHDNLGDVCAKGLVILDVPLSIAVDTVMLPVDAVTAAVK